MKDQNKLLGVGEKVKCDCQQLHSVDLNRAKSIYSPDIDCKKCQGTGEVIRDNPEAILPKVPEMVRVLRKIYIRGHLQNSDIEAIKQALKTAEGEIVEKAGK